ncbi:hypothetical protein D3C80_1631900 [compost metagenome]
MRVGKGQRFALLEGDFIPRQRIQQGGGKVCQLQAALNVARGIPQQGADLRDGFALLLQRSETDNLLGRVHIFTLTVFGHGGHHRQFQRDHLHRNKWRVRIGNPFFDQNARCPATPFPADHTD